jgi:uncharacterized protein
MGPDQEPIVRSMTFVFLLSLFFAAASTTASPAAETQPLKIEAAAGDREFAVEIVREEKERNRGLMFRRHMADDRGMLFDYNPPQAVSFWMKNTYIPLDIIFIDANGRIITIAENTTPLSLETIPSGGVARAVLEINGGLAKKLGIKVGDRVRHAFFDEK